MSFPDDRHLLFSRRHWITAEGIDVRRLWWGWWIDGAWCPTPSIALHRINKLRLER
jgi:hypothetical protein